MAGVNMSEQTPESIAFLRPLLPMFVSWLKMPQTLDDFVSQGKKVNWDWVNDAECTCGLPESPCPDHIAAQRLGLKPDGV